MKTLVAMLIACVVAALPCRSQTAAAPDAGVRLNARPAMWKIAGTKGTVYLFGSVHVMRKDVRWETPEVKRALADSGILYLEIANIDEDSLKALQPIVLQMGMDAEHPLSSKLSKEDVERLDAAVKKLGLPGEQAFEPMKPWLAYLTLTVAPAIEAGYDPKLGIDQLLLADAKEQNKPVKGFETAEQQMHFLADMPEAEQVQLLHQTLEDLPKSAGEMNEIVADWTRGDVEKIAALDNDELKVKSPGLYNKLLVNRNQHFAAVLADLLKDPTTGTIFVAVGAGHLAGPDSVLADLDKLGWKATRVE